MKEIKITIEIKGEDKDNNNTNKNNSEEELKSFLGEEFIGYKGRDAIDKLMEERRGYIKDAFFRKEIGNIALVWGDDKKGLQHIIKRRKELKQPLGKLFDSLVEVIENGEISTEDNKLKIYYKRKNAIIGFSYDGHKLTFLVSAYYDYDYEKNTSW